MIRTPALHGRAPSQACGRGGAPARRAPRCRAPSRLEDELNEPWACARNHLLAGRNGAVVCSSSAATSAAGVVVAPTMAEQPESTMEEESLGILEWPSVCRQVACFCRTPMAAECALAGLPLGRTREESELLLEQTQEALAANLPVEGILDLRPAVEAAVGGACLNAKQLEGVAATLEAALRLREAAYQTSAGGTGEPRFPLLAAIAAGIAEEEIATVAALRECIRGGSVTDAADPALAATRAERSANLTELRSLVTGLARELSAKGAAESREPLLMRGRFCVAVRSNRRSELPKGSIKLGASSSGATVYMEPAPAVAMNNRETELAAREEEQAVAVLVRLSARLAQRTPRLVALLHAVAQLDLANARAKHARWLDGVRPAFYDGTNAAEDGPIDIPGALHPLLLEPALPPLPRAPTADDQPFAANFAAIPTFGTVPSKGQQALVEPLTAPRPRPLELCVPAGTRVVAITGPNTGGKTVSLKVAGLAVLMAKAGLFLPTEGVPGATVPRAPRLTWYSSVLADIGDAQSLQQNLSTFSGHVRRLRRVLSAAGPSSLVLLDEVGSGTDPGEGAALARAVLDALASSAGLTLATTHHAELRAAATDDPRYAAASMGFDTQSLAPTYTLTWGSVGASNALDIAQRLGFDAAVVGDARRLAETEEAARAAAAADMARVAASVGQQLADTRARLERRRQARAAREARLGVLRGAERELAGLRSTVRRGPSLVSQVVARSVLELQLALAGYRRGEIDGAALTARLEALEALLPQSLRPGQGGGAASGGLLDASDIKVGDKVVVPKLGVFGEGTVIKVDGDALVVQVTLPGLTRGTSKFKVGVDEVALQQDVREAAKQARAQSELGGDRGGGSAYLNLLQRVEEALAALSVGGGV